MEPSWRRGGGPAPVHLPMSWLAARQGDVAQVEDRKRVSLRVEDPIFQRHQVVAGEQQVQIPGGWGRGVGGRWRDEKEWEEERSVFVNPSEL